jgi:aerobic carbon-monoxide dehydrogenase medium subunit
MKLPPFDYARPATLAQAIELLADNEGAKIISGGQSLMPILAFRLASPSLLVDLRDVGGLDQIQVSADGVRLGARVRWVDIEKDERLSGAHPLLKAAIGHVAHYQVRNRGTVGGSVSHADPAAEMPGVSVACDAVMEIASRRGARRVPAGEFFTGPLQTVLEEDEILTAVHLPAWPGGRRWAFQEFARRRGDFAIAGVLLHFDLDGDGRVANARVGAIGVGDRPLRLEPCEAVLDGAAPDDGLIARLTEAARRTLDPPNDLHAESDYRRALYATLLERAARQALLPWEGDA